MAELIAVVHTNGEQSPRLLSTIERLQRERQIALVEGGFAQRLCGALSSEGSLVLFVARDAEQARREMEACGGIVMRASLPEVQPLEAQAVGGSENPQMRGQRRRESGGESTEESGQ
jgi:hypothetical protein